MFEKASKLKLRFDTVVGDISTEDLWDLPLTGSRASLDDVAKMLNKQIKDGDEESFVAKKSNEDSILSLQFDIVKHIIRVRLADIERQENLQANKAKKERIMAIIANKEDESLTNLSPGELKELLVNM